MKTLMTAAALAAAAFAVSAPASFAMTSLDSQLERAVYNDIVEYGFDGTFSEAQIAALSVNDLVLLDNIFSEQETLEAAETLSPVVQHRISDIITR